MASTSHKSQRSLHGKHVAQMYQGFIFPQLYLQLPFLWLTPLSSSSYYFKSISCLFAHLHLQLSSLFKKNNNKKKQTNPFGDKERESEIEFVQTCWVCCEMAKEVAGSQIWSEKISVWNKEPPSLFK